MGIHEITDHIAAIAAGLVCKVNKFSRQFLVSAGFKESKDFFSICHSYFLSAALRFKTASTAS